MSESEYPRQYYKAPGGRPLLWYCFFGEFPSPLQIEVPEGIQVQRFTREKHPDIFGNFLTDYIGSVLDEDEKLSERVRGSGQMLRVRGDLDDQPTLGYLADTLAGLCELAWDHGVAVLDPQTLTWYSAEDFRETFNPITDDPHIHVVTLKSEEGDGGYWFHTRGMRKFGRPDIGVHGVPEADEEMAIEVINRLVDFQARGAVVPDGQEINMRDVPEGMVARLSGSLDDPDYNNLHLSIKWPSA